MTTTTRVLTVAVALCASARAGRAQEGVIETRVVRAPNVPAGRVMRYVINDSSYHRRRQVWVYTPPGYDEHARAPYPLMVAFDGGEYFDTMPLPMILDTLLAAHRAPAFVAVLVDDSLSATRIADLGNAHRMVDFLASQILPWVRRGWRVTSDPHRVIVTGSSAGGLASAYVAFMRDDLFGNVWSQSGAFWRGAEASNEPPYEWFTAQVSASPGKDVRFVLDVGDQEIRGALGGAAPSIRDANRHLRDALTAKGYPVTYLEVVDGNHAEQWWRQRLPEGIVLLSADWAAPDGPLTGRWQGTFDAQDNPVGVTLVLRQRDTTLTGRFYRGDVLYNVVTEGVVHGNAFSFHVEGLVFNGTITGDRLNIDLTLLGGGLYSLPMHRASAGR